MPVSVHELPKNFKEQYKSSDFVYEYDFKSNGISMWQRFKRWLNDFFQRIFDFDSPVSAQKFTEYFIKTIYIIAFIAIIYLIVKTLIQKEGNWVFGRRSDTLDITTETIEVDLLQTNFKDLIAAATHKKDYRLATRYYYLQSLQKLSQKGLIDWDAEKTNQDYFNEITDPKLQKKFSYISYLYNYSWYGEFELNSTTFKEIKVSFHSLYKSIA